MNFQVCFEGGCLEWDEHMMFLDKFIGCRCGEWGVDGHVHVACGGRSIEVSVH